MDSKPLWTPKNLILVLLLVAISPLSFVNADAVIVRSGGLLWEMVPDGAGKPPKLKPLEIDIDLDVDPTPDPDDPDPDPDPGPDPDPVVPTDGFDNVGQLSFRLAEALPAAARKRSAATAKVYADAADKLENGELPSITAAAKWVSDERSKAWASDAPSWTKVTEGILPTWNKFWPMDKVKVIAFYRAVSVGLRAAQPAAKKEEPLYERVTK